MDMNVEAEVWFDPLRQLLEVFLLLLFFFFFDYFLCFSFGIALRHKVGQAHGSSYSHFMLV